MNSKSRDEKQRFRVASGCKGTELGLHHAVALVAELGGVRVDVAEPGGLARVRVTDTCATPTERGGVGEQRGDGVSRVTGKNVEDKRRPKPTTQGDMETSTVKGGKPNDWGLGRGVGLDDTLAINAVPEHVHFEIHLPRGPSPSVQRSRVRSTAYSDVSQRRDKWMAAKAGDTQPRKCLHQTLRYLVPNDVRHVVRALSRG